MSDPVERLAAALADRYAIERQLGVGGMATVYLARDVKHDRQVALKVLRPELAAVLGVERFLSEIRVTSHLQHPHILPLFDSGQAAGLIYYVMPYVQGESLRGRLTREKQLDVTEALELTRAVASALDYAHRHDVIHRDIKPENILLAEGQPVVADFGIALAVSAAGGNRITETGISLGTPQYMSPEQATGDRLIDQRTDIYSLACVVYEMLSGEPPHTGPTVQAVIARVVTDRPRRLSTLRDSVAPHVEAAVHKALAKIPADRFASVAQFAEALARPGLLPLLPAEVPVAPTLAERGWRGISWPRAVPWVVAALALAAAAEGGLRRRSPPPEPVVRYALSPPPDAQFTGGGPGTTLALSPDAARLVYLSTSGQTQQLYQWPLDRLEPVPIPDTRGAVQPFFSPDGKWLGFVAEQRIHKVSLEGGPAITVCGVPGSVSGASWAANNLIVFSTSGALWRVSADGGEPTIVARPDSARREVWYRWPEALPDGRAAVVTVLDSLGWHLAVVSLETGKVVPLGQMGTSARFVAPGYLVFATSAGSLVAAPFDPRAARITGPVVPIAEAVRVGTGGAAKAAVSASGSIAYVPDWEDARTPVFVDRAGRVQVIPVPQQTFWSAAISPDSRRVAFDIGPGGGRGDIWILDLVRNTLSRLTHDSMSLRPVWTPDGRRIAFTKGSGPPSTYDLWWIAADGGDTAQQLLAAENGRVPSAFTPDGRELLFEERGPDTRGDISILPLDGAGKPTKYLQSPFDEGSPTVSPDGHWVAYNSDESGQREVYVRSFPIPGARIQVSTGGGWSPLWSPVGGELFYRSAAGVVAVSLSRDRGISVGARRVLFSDTVYVASGARQGNAYDLQRDGRRFLMIRKGEERHGAMVLLHWFDNLRVKRH